MARLLTMAFLATAALALSGIPTAAASPEAPRTDAQVALRQGQVRLLTLESAIRSLFGIHFKAVASISADNWSILRNQPIGLAIGNARLGWGFEPSYRSQLGYTAGYVHGSFNGCAWTATRNLGGMVIPVRADCAGFDPPLASFTSRINCAVCHGGTRVDLRAGAVEYANYSPSTGPRDPVHLAQAGQCVEWRYLSADGRMAMVKDRRWSNNRASWVFIRRTALPPDLPHGSQISC